MSILPLLLELVDNHTFEDAFGYMVYPEHPSLQRQHSLNSTSGPMCKRQCALRPHRHYVQNKYHKAGNLNKNFDKDGFQVTLDTKDFAPNEISVKTIDNTIVVEGKHEEKEDEHGHISRHFIRKYTLPKEADVNDVISTLSADGQLTIRAPPKPKSVHSTERVIQIQQTGEAHQPLKTSEAAEKVTDRVEKAAD